MTNFAPGGFRQFRVNLNLEVLVVDDSDLQRAHFKMFLEEIGCRVQEANHGGQALEVLKNSKPDIVLLDFVMPELDGFGLLKRMQADPETACIPVVCVTGKKMNEAARHEIETEPNVKKLYSKPVGFNDLFRLLSDLSKDLGKFSQNPS